MLDDLYQADTDAAINDLVRRPPAAKPQAAKFSAWGTLTAAPRGVLVGGMESGAMVPDLAEGIGNVFTRATVDFLPEPQGGGGAEFRKREKERAQGASSVEGDLIRKQSREFMPDPQTTHTAENLVFQGARFMSKAVAQTATLGPVAGAASLSVDEGLTAADELRQQGVDLETRTKVGAVVGVLSGVGAVLPVAGRNPVQTAALVAVGGPGSFIAQQAATRQILQDADYTKLADQIDPLDPVGLAVSTLVPAGFGVWAMRGMRGRPAEIKPGEPAPEVRPDAAPVQDAVQTEPARPRPTPDQVDAARVEMLTQHVESARLTPPEDVIGARAHDEAMARAMDQLARGERVEVSDVAPVPRVAPTETPEFKAWFGHSKAVDSQGAPMVMYHGTTANFDAIGSQADVNGGNGNKGIYFTRDPAYAKPFADGEGGNIVPVFLRMENPKITSDPIESGIITQKQIEQLQSQGHDGIINTANGEHVVFDAKQVKSAIGNSGKFDQSSTSLTDSRFASWADQINAAIEDIRAAAAKEAANVQDAPQARADAPATGARQPEPAAQPQAADARGAAPAGAAEQGGGVPRAGGASVEAAAVAARLADVSQQFPDLTVQMDGMDSPMRLSDFLEQVKREAMDGTDMDIGGNDAPLMQVAASCFLLNGA